MRGNSHQRAFLELLRAGLWEKDIQLAGKGSFIFQEVYKLAQEQSVIGLVAAGIEHIIDIKPPSEVVLLFVGNALQLEQRNIAKNAYLANLVDKMRSLEVYTLLLKGQGIAQCYEKPLWRSSGDVDFFLSEDNYNKAIKVLSPMASAIEIENKNTRHLGMTLGTWEVELHGSLRGELWESLDNVLDEVKDAIIYDGKVRSWMNGATQIFLPRADEDIVYVFSHILQHFFKGGIGLRQICDWCRLLMTYHKTIDTKLLHNRLRKAGIVSEWNVFAALANEYLGMPLEALPMYNKSDRWQRKAKKLLEFIFETGNFGYNRDMSFLNSSSIIERKSKRFWYITKDTLKQFTIFPIDSIKVWVKVIGTGIRLLI